MTKRIPQDEAERLISEVKQCLIDVLYAPEKGKQTVFQLQGRQTMQNYTVTIFRGNKNPGKYNYNARITVNNIVLLELHINPTNRHINPDGQIIIGSHWHIYKEGYDLRYAFPAKEVEEADFVNNTVLFLKKFGLLELPAIYDQLESDL